MQFTKQRKHEHLQESLLNPTSKPQEKQVKQELINQAIDSEIFKKKKHIIEEIPPYSVQHPSSPYNPNPNDSRPLPTTLKKHK